MNHLRYLVTYTVRLMPILWVATILFAIMLIPWQKGDKIPAVVLLILRFSYPFSSDVVLLVFPLQASHLFIITLLRRWDTARLYVNVSALSISSLALVLYCTIYALTHRVDIAGVISTMGPGFWTVFGATAGWTLLILSSHVWMRLQNRVIGLHTSIRGNTLLAEPTASELTFESRSAPVSKKSTMTYMCSSWSSLQIVDASFQGMPPSTVEDSVGLDHIPQNLGGTRSQLACLSAETTELSPPITVSFMTEKKNDLGEDAEPLLNIGNDGLGLISVFDGMGGAGSRIYVDENGTKRTGAYWSARTIRSMTEIHFLEKIQPYSDVSLNPTLIATDLKASFHNAFSKLLADLRTEESLIRSKMMRRLPTTMAALYFQRSAVQNQTSNSFNVHDIFAVWAGDSRCYMLTPLNGLQQLSTDDLKASNNALENIRDDAPLSNFINAETEFTLNVRHVCEKKPFALLVATDGCFGYLDSPFHFEYLLLDTLKYSANVENWQTSLKKCITINTQDDTSLALIAIGWSDFSVLKLDFEQRIQYLQPLIQQVEIFNQQLKRTRESFSSSDDKLAQTQVGTDPDHNVASIEYQKLETIERLWEEYRITYEARLSSDETDTNCNTARTTQNT